MYNLPNEVLIHSYLIIRSFYITLSLVALAALWVFAHRRWPPAAAGSGWAKPNDIHAAALAASDKYISSGRMEMSFWSRAGHGWLAGYFFFPRSLFRKLQRHNVLCAQLTIFPSYLILESSNQCVGVCGRLFNWRLMVTMHMCRIWIWRRHIYCHLHWRMEGKWNVCGDTPIQPFDTVWNANMAVHIVTRTF